MTFGQSISTVFKKYAEFRGLAGRAEFWWWILFTSLVSAALNMLPVWRIDIGYGSPTSGGGLAGLWAIAVLLPTLAVTVRRLRDAGCLWGHIFWLLLPVAGLIILIVICAQPTRALAPASRPGEAATSGQPNT